MKTSPSPSAPVKVLLVDDNRNGLMVRSALIKEWGYEVEIAENGAEGLKLFRGGRFDAVVTDLKMPVMDGIALIAAIRKIQPEARVILLSGFIDPLGLTEESTGADAVVAKSATEANRLARTLRRLLNSGPARKPPSRQRGGVRSRAAGAR